MKKFLIPLFTFTFALHLCGATNLVSNTAIVTNRVQSIVTYTMSNGVARVQDPSGKLIGTAEERALKVAAEGQVDIASAAADAAGTAMEEWLEFTATTDVKVVYIDAGFTQDLPALAPNLCGWVAGSFYDREKGEDHYYVWFNREIDYPPSMCARIISESGTNWLDAAWVDWAVTNLIDKATGREWARPYSAEVEYLQSTGTQGIEFNIDKTNLGYSFIGKVSLDSSQTETYPRIFGNQDGMYMIAMSHQTWWYGTILQSRVDNLPIPRNTAFDFVADNTGIELGGVRYSIANPVLSIALKFDRMGLFGQVQEGVLKNFTKVKIYSFRVLSNGEIVYDFVPVLDLSGRPAMYDRVSGQLFYNQGTGEFSYGPVTAAPVPCRELVVKRRNANCVLKTGTVITLGGRDGFDADIHKVNIEVGGTPTPTTSAQLPLFYAVTRSGTNTVTRAYTNGFLNVENGFIKEPTNEY